MLRKIVEYLCRIEGDKYVHLLACLLLSFLLGCISLVFIDVWIAPIVAFFATVIAGVAKELTDDHIDRKDLVANVIGTLLGVLLVLFAYWVLMSIK